MEVRFVAGVTPIVESAAEARKFYGEQLGLPVKEQEGEPGGHVCTKAVDGAMGDVQDAQYPVNEGKANGDQK